jgi:hypothetical protein
MREVVLITAAKRTSSASSIKVIIINPYGKYQN